MLKNIESLRLCCIEGEVMVHDGGSGWQRGYPGMEVPAVERVAIKTGRTGRCEIANSHGRRISIEPNSLYVLGEPCDPELVDTLPRVTMEKLDRKISTPHIIRQRLVPVG